MIGVDANVLIRLLTADDPAQYEKAVAFFTGRSAESPVFVSAVTLAETVWVLRRTYSLSVSEISGSVRGLLNAADLVIEGRDSLASIQMGDLSPSMIADLLVVHSGRRSGCSHTVTFDRRASRAIPSMKLLA
jgi:predicted nucleic-acid-binding protein